MNLIYIGTSVTALNLLVNNDEINIQHVICEQKRTTKELLNIVNHNKLKIYQFDKKIEFIEIVKEFDPLKYSFLIYQFDYIVPEILTSRYNMFNIHAGNLGNNRGRHPIIWSILNGDMETEMTIHKIDEKIDQGLVVGIFQVDIDEDDGGMELKRKMEEGLPDLINDMILFLKGEKEGLPASGGIYRNPIQENDYTIDFFNDPINIIKNKIRSQKQFYGAIAVENNTKYYIIELFDLIMKSNNTQSINIQSDYITVNRKNESFSLKIIK